MVHAGEMRVFKAKYPLRLAMHSFDGVSLLESGRCLLFHQVSSIYLSDVHAKST